MDVKAADLSGYVGEVFKLFGDRDQLEQRGIPDSLTLLREWVNENKKWSAVGFFACVDNDVSQKLVTMYTRLSGEILQLSLKSISQGLIDSKRANDRSWSTNFQYLGSKTFPTSSTRLKSRYTSEDWTKFCGYLQGAPSYKFYNNPDYLTPVLKKHWKS